MMLYPETLNHQQNIYFCGDWHLPPDSKNPLWTMFYQLLEQLAKEQCHLVIIGDWLSYWLGADWGLRYFHPLFRYIQSWQQETGLGVAMLVGNRDFALRASDLSIYQINLWPDYTTIQIGNSRCLLSHGDQWCTLDKSYQILRKILRHPKVQQYLLHTPITWRIWLAKQLSRDEQQQPQNQTDLSRKNTIAIDQTVKVCHEHQASVCIHGHIHQPGIHHDAVDVKRFVVSDWQVESGGIGVMWKKNGSPGLVQWSPAKALFEPVCTSFHS